MHTTIEKWIDEGRIIIEPGGCWTWAGHIMRNGYGQVRHDGATRLAHRVVFALAGHTIPANRPHLDHLCRHRACVNPDHLEAVTQAENNRRVALTRTHCAKGHPYTTDNTAVVRRRSGRICITCRRASVVAARTRSAA